MSKMIWLFVFAASTCWATAGWGQTLLERAEAQTDEALRGRSGRATAPPAGAPPAAPDDLPAPADEEAPKFYMGVEMVELAGGGIRVVNVAEDGPAAQGGLQTGDMIVSANKTRVSSDEDLSAAMKDLTAGDKLELAVLRRGREVPLEITLGQPPSAGAPDAGPAGTAPGDTATDPSLPAADPTEPAVPPEELGTEPGSTDPAIGPRPGASPQRASRGITVVTNSDEVRARYDAPATSGAFVTNIRPESPAARAGLPLGAVIVTFEGERINTADELVEAISASAPGTEVELTYYDKDKLRRRTVKLAAAADPSLLGPGYGGSRRGGGGSLGELERRLGGAGSAAAADGDDAAESLRAPAAGSDTLRDEVEVLKARIEALERRLADIEGKLPEMPEGDDGAAPALRDDAGGEPAVGGEPAEEAAPVVPRTRLIPPGSKGGPTLRPPPRPSGTKIGDE